jgi:hypothetical protein
MATAHQHRVFRIDGLGHGMACVAPPSRRYQRRILPSQPAWRMLIAWRTEVRVNGETTMQLRRSVMLSLALSMLATAPAWSASAMKMLDPDNDGTIDLAEAKAAASKLFDKLDPDRDGTLDRRELRGRLSAREFVAANPDNDGTIDKNEYLALVERRFNAANPDNDGTIDAKELASPAGKALLKLLR